MTTQTDTMLAETPSVRTRESDVTRVVHSGLIMRPIYELEARRFSVEGDETQEIRDSIDIMWVAFAVLDSISELTEYHVGATRKEVLEKVFPAIEKQASAAGANLSEESVMEILSKVFDHLVNRDNRYLPFQYRYFDGASSAFQTRRFWLVKAVYTGKGQSTLFALTEEGYAAYFGLHETSALDSTSIGNLRIKLLIERGNVDDAIAVAQQNNKQCARKAHDIRNTRRAIQRNIHSIDFSRINAMADEGTGQATQIQRESSRLHHMVLDNLQMTENEGQEYKLLQLARHLKRLDKRQMELVGELQRLPDDYHQNSHKLFRKRASGILPSLDEVLRRVCRMEESDAARVGREFIAIFDPPVQTPLFDPGSVIDAISQSLERRSTSGDKGQALQEIDGESVEHYEPELTAPLMKKAAGLIRNRVRTSEATPMEEILKEALLSREEPLLATAVAMNVFQCIIDSRTGARNGFSVTLKNPPGYINLDLPDNRKYRGHHLTLTPAGSKDTVFRDL